MSYSSCSNSAIANVAPDSYPYGAIGSIIIPTLLTGASTASGVAAAAFNSITLPKGIWLLTGVLELQALTGGANITLYTANPRKDGVSIGQLDGFYTENSHGLNMCNVVSCDGTNAIDVAIQCTTSAGNWTIVAGISSQLRLVRIA